MLQLGQHGLHAMKASPHRPPLCREHNPGASCALERRSRGAPEWKNSPSDTAIGRVKQRVQHPLPGLAAGTRGLPLRWLSRCALTRASITRASIPRASIPRAELGPAAPGEKTRRLPCSLWACVPRGPDSAPGENTRKCTLLIHQNVARKAAAGFGGGPVDQPSRVSVFSSQKEV